MTKARLDRMVDRTPSRPAPLALRPNALFRNVSSDVPAQYRAFLPVLLGGGLLVLLVTGGDIACIFAETPPPELDDAACAQLPEIELSDKRLLPGWMKAGILEKIQELHQEECGRVKKIAFVSRARMEELEKEANVHSDIIVHQRGSFPSLLKNVGLGHLNRIDDAWPLQWKEAIFDRAAKTIFIDDAVLQRTESYQPTLRDVLFPIMTGFGVAIRSPQLIDAMISWSIHDIEEPGIPAIAREKLFIEFPNFYREYMLNGQTLRYAAQRGDHLAELVGNSAIPEIKGYEETVGRLADLHDFLQKVVFKRDFNTGPAFDQLAAADYTIMAQSICTKAEHEDGKCIADLEKRPKLTHDDAVLAPYREVQPQPIEAYLFGRGVALALERQMPVSFQSEEGRRYLEAVGAYVEVVGPQSGIPIDGVISGAFLYLGSTYQPQSTESIWDLWMKLRTAYNEVAYLERWSAEGPDGAPIEKIEPVAVAVHIADAILKLVYGTDKNWSYVELYQQGKISKPYIKKVREICLTAGDQWCAESFRRFCPDDRELCVE